MSSALTSPRRWILNYASTHAELVDFYRNIHVNLKPGGLYLGVTPPPNENAATHYERVYSQTSTSGFWQVMDGGDRHG